MDRSNWDDLRYILAVYEAGTVSGAARLLDVTHGTVIRRVAAFEALHGEPVFARSASGYALLPGKAAVIEAARDVENAVLTVGRLLAGGQEELRGPVRITSTDTLCLTVLPRAIEAIAARHPALELALICSNLPLDYARAGVDVTVRPAMSLPAGLEGEAVATLAFGVYAAPGGADRWLRLEGPLARAVPAEWMRRELDEGATGPGADSFVILREMAAAGLGRCWMPRILGEGDPRLVLRTDLVPPIEAPLWVACQPELATSARLRAVRTGLAAVLRGLEPELRGERPLRPAGA